MTWVSMKRIWDLFDFKGFSYFENFIDLEGFLLFY